MRPPPVAEPDKTPISLPDRAAQSRTLLQAQRSQIEALSIVEACEAELGASPDDARAARLHFELARAHERDTDSPSLALEHYQKALELIRDHKPSMRAARRLLLAQGSEAALELFDAEVRLTSDPAHRALLWRAKARAIEDVGQECKAARPLYAKAADLDSSSPTILKSAEQCALDAQDWVGVAKALERTANAVKDDPRYRAAVVVRRARVVETHLKHIALAIELYSSALGIDPRCTGAFEGLKRLLFAEERWRELVEVLEREAKQTTNPEIAAAALLRAAQIHAEKLSELAEAVDALTRAAELQPRDRLILEELVRIQGLTGDPVGLAAALEQLVEVTDSTAERLDLYYRIGQLQETEHPAKATGWYEAALAMSAAYVPAIRALEKLYEDAERWTSLVAMYLAEAEEASDADRRAHAHARAAEILEHRLGEREQAAEHHGLAIGLQPDLAGSFKALTRLYAAMERHHGLAELYSRALERAPDDELAIAYLFKIGALQEEALQDPAAAMHAYRRVLERQRGHLGAIHALQRTAEAACRYQELVEALDLETARTDRPERIVALQHRAAEVLDEKLGDTDAAVLRYRKVLERSPGYAPTIASLGTLYRKLGRHEDLLEVLERELELLKRPAEQVALLHHMGALCEERLGDHARALGFYRRAFRVAPTHRPSVNALAERLRAQEDWKGLAEVLQSEMGEQSDPVIRASAACQLGEVYELHLEQLGAAAQAYRDALEALPGYRPAVDALCRVQTQARLYKELTEDLVLDGERVDDPVLAGEAMLRAGHVWETHLHDDNRAILIYEGLRESDPKNMAALLALSPLYRKTEAWEQLADLQRAQAALLTDPAARLAVVEELARLLEVHKIGSQDDLVSAYRDILALDSGNRTALSGLERIGLQQRDRELLATVDRGCTQLADDPAVLGHHHARLGESLEHGDPAAALPAYRAALLQDGDSLAAIRGLGRVGEELDDVQLIVEALHREASWTRDPKAAADLLVRSADIRVKRQGDRTAAIADAERALELCPAHAEAADRLSDMMLAAEQPDRLIDCLSRAAEATRDEPRKLALWQAVGWLHADAKEDLPAAIAALERTRQGKPNHVPVLMQLGDLYERNGLFKDAVDTLSRVIEIGADPKELSIARLQLGRVLARHLDEPTAATSHLEALLEVEPQHREALALLLDLRVQAGALPAAIETAEQILEGSDAFDDQRRTLRKLGRIYMQAGDRKAAAKALRDAVALEGPTGKAAWTYKKLLGRDEHPRHYADALSEHIKRVKTGELVDDELAAAYLELARTQHAELHQADEALATLQSGLQLCSEDPRLWLEMAEQLARMGRAAEALEQFQQLTSADPTEANAYRGMARVLQGQTRHAEAAVAIAPVLVVGEASDVERNLAAKHGGRAGQASPSSLNALALQAITACEFDEGPLIGLFNVLSDALSKLYPLESKGDRLSTRSEHRLPLLCEQVGQAFGFNGVELYVSSNAAPFDVLAAPGRTPSLIVAPSVAERPEPQQVFLLGRSFAHLARGLAPAVWVDRGELAMIVAAVARSQDEEYARGEFDDQELALLQKRLLKEVAWLSRKNVAAAVEQLLAHPPVDLHRWTMDADRTANRAAALLAGDLVACVDLLGEIEGKRNMSGAELVARSAAVTDLVRFWASEPALALRRHAGMIG